MDNILKAFPTLATRSVFFPCMMFPSPNRPGKTDKIPCTTTGHRLEGWNKRENQTNLQLAISSATILNSHPITNHTYAIGRAFDGTDNDWFVDIDKGLNQAGTWSDATLEICQRFAGAGIELSQSKRGLHIYCKGFIPAITHNNQAEGIEIHGHRKFAVVTGLSAQGNPDLDCTEALKWLIEKYGTSSKAPGGSIYKQWVQACGEPPHSSHTVIATDEEVISRMLTGAVPFGRSAKTLYGGDMEGYPSASEATAALASHLAFWTGNDAKRMQRLMESSPAFDTEMGAKWDRWDILPRAILFARGVQTTFYYSNRSKDITPTSTNQGLILLPLQRCQYSQLTENGKPANSVDNLKQLLTYYGITVRWNDMSHMREVNIPRTVLHIGDAENSALCHIIDLCSSNNLPVMRIDEQLNVIAQENTYHPIVESMLNKPWDGVPRLDRFIKTLKTKDDDTAHPLVRVWMIATIAAAFSERGFTHQGILVLEGPQGTEKTRWVKSLEPIDCNAVKEAMLLDLANKDCIITALSHWIVELGELDGTIRKTDMAKLKSFSTSQVDIVRFPYARKNTRLYRRTSFVASVNEPRFLTDPTGNRRWWVVSIVSIDLLHGLDMQQVWAEAYQYWREGEKPYLDKEQIKTLNSSNSEYEMIDPFEERLLSFFDWTDGWQKKEKQELTSSDVLRQLGFLQNGNKQEPTRMANILRKYTTPSHTKRCYWLPIAKGYK